MEVAAITASAYAGFDLGKKGMDRAEKRFETAAAKIAGGEVGASEVVDMIGAERSFQANAAVVRTQDEMIGTLLDVKR